MKPKLKLVKNTKRIKVSQSKKRVRPGVAKAFNRALKAAQQKDWSSVIIIGSDNDMFHTPMRYKDLVGLMEFNKHITMQEWLNS